MKCNTKLIQLIKTSNKLFLKFSLTIFFSLLATTSYAAWDLNMTKGKTEVSEIMYDLHMIVVWLSVLLSVLVYGVMMWTIFAHRKSKGHKAAQFKDNVKLEIFWTIVPIIILAFLAFPAISAVQKMYDHDPADMNIKVTGSQWKWSYQYLEEDNFSFDAILQTPREQIDNHGSIKITSITKWFNSDDENAYVKKDDDYLLNVKPLVVPINTKIRLLITAKDVIHSWWVPELGIKMDAVPGYINETWFEVKEEGFFYGQCAELCGKDHGFMPIAVKAYGKEEYKKVIAEMKAVAKEGFKVDVNASPEQVFKELYDKGKELYNQRCAACHLPSGKGNPPLFPAMVSNAMVNADDTTDLIETVLYGRQGTAMPGFDNQLGTVEISAVLNYIRNSWYNDNKNKVITSKDINKFKAEKK